MALARWAAEPWASGHCRRSCYPPRPRQPLLVHHGVLAPRAAWRSAVVPPAAQNGRDPEPRRGPARLTWFTLLRRVFAIDVLVCPRCAGPRRILCAVTEPHALGRLLAALGLAASRPRAAPSRLLDPPPSRRPADVAAGPVCQATLRARADPDPSARQGPCAAGRRRATVRVGCGGEQKPGRTGGEGSEKVLFAPTCRATRS
jgi:hypothetical protein